MLIYIFSLFLISFINSSGSNGDFLRLVFAFDVSGLDSSSAAFLSAFYGSGSGSHSVDFLLASRIIEA